MAEVEVVVCKDTSALGQEAAERFVAAAQEATWQRGRFSVALSGGSTPRALYTKLVEEPQQTRVPWPEMQVFWGDERHVPPGHADSNYRTAGEALLAKVPVPEANVHRIKAEQPDVEQIAADYEATLREVFQLSAGELPRFDLVLLGMGADGHTASLFPGTDALHAPAERLVVAPWVEKFQSHRITLTLPVLCHARLVMFLVGGEDKAETLRSVLEGEGEPAAQSYPAQLVRPTAGKVVWLLDQAAASRLQ